MTAETHTTDLERWHIPEQEWEFFPLEREARLTDDPHPSALEPEPPPEEWEEDDDIDPDVEDRPRPIQAGSSGFGPCPKC